MWSQILDNSSLFVLITLPSLDLIFQDEDPSVENFRVMIMESPKSLWRYASSPLFFSCMLTSEALESQRSSLSLSIEKLS